MAFFVKPETVGQYIGLKDKKNKEIYEDDIVEDKFGKRFGVKYNYNQYEPIDGSAEYGYLANELTIIGNLHQQND